MSEDLYGLVSRSGVLEVADALRKKIRAREPLSLLRLGDGEGRLMGYPELVDKNSGDDLCLDHSLKIVLGKTDYEQDLLIDLSTQLRSAVKNADIVGLPRKKQYESHEAYRFVFQAAEAFGLIDRHHMITDAAIHRYLQFGLFYKLLLDNLNFVGLISGREGLSGKIKEVFHIKHMEHYLIPAEAIHPEKNRGLHFPDRFYELKQQIRVPYKGALFLIGAGFLGKIYCHWIKEAGGIAIDIGGICDSWAGVGRLQNPYHKLTRYQGIHRLEPHFAVAQFNEAMDYFKIDAPRIQLDSLGLERLKSVWSE